MSFSLHRPTKSNLVAVGLSALMGFTALAFSARSYLPSTLLPSKRPIKSTVNDVSANSPIKAILFTYYSGGVEPAEISLPPGKYVVTVDNRSGEDNLSLSFFNSSQNRKLKDAALTLKQLSWNGLFDFTPGEYTLSETTHPQWVARIRIVAN